MKKIVLTGGGTAGHVYPALAVAEKLKGYEIHFVGSSGMERDILKNFPYIKYHEISAVKLERKLTFKNLLIPFKLFSSIRQAKKILLQIRPDVIFSKGGFVAVPVAIAGARQNIPIVSHESDLTFGLANKIILRYCKIMCTSFEETANRKKCVYTGQPIRQDIFQGKKQMFNFSNSLPTILILGGSLGAQFLNSIVFENLEKLTSKYNILHICGRKNFKNIKHKNYHSVPYADNIQDFYATADIVISRAGSGVINELLCLAKPMLLIPLSKQSSRGDQIENAKLFEKKGYCEVIKEEEYNFNLLQQKVEKLLKNAKKIKQNMKNTAKNDAVDKIAQIISEY